MSIVFWTVVTIPFSNERNWLSFFSLESSYTVCSIVDKLFLAQLQVIFEKLVVSLVKGHSF